jgi:putative RNA 2'-phosphotransferase
MEKELKYISKFLSYTLRHHPEKIGLTLDSKGWAGVLELIEKMNTANANITLEKLETIVAANDKKRFAFNDDKTKIRASQGHSIPIDLDLEPAVPPVILYHGTAIQYLEGILEKGLLKQSRQHVHLSATRETASQVGSRHGKVVILTIQALQMHRDGYVFYLSDNNVWLTDHVPPTYIEK